MNLPWGYNKKKELTLKNRVDRAYIEAILRERLLQEGRSEEEIEAAIRDLQTASPGQLRAVVRPRWEYKSEMRVLGLPLVHIVTGRDPKTGRVKYAGKLTGKGSGIYADGMLYCYGEKGQLGLARVSPTGYDLVSAFKITKGEEQHWAHPAISDGRLYIRHGEVLMCFDIKG